MYKASEHFIELMKDINLQNEDYLVSSDISLFTNVPVEEVFAIRNILGMAPSLHECSRLQVEDLMELLDICLKTMYLQFEDKFYQQKECMAMGSSQSLVVSNIFMEHIEETALDTADYKPTKWLRYVDDTFMVWPHGPARLQSFLDHINSMRPTIKSPL
jgi:hypothetical protein